MKHLNPTVNSVRMSLVFAQELGSENTTPREGESERYIRSKSINSHIKTKVLTFIISVLVYKESEKSYSWLCTVEYDWIVKC